MNPVFLEHAISASVLTWIVVAIAICIVTMLAIISLAYYRIIALSNRQEASNQQTQKQCEQTREKCEETLATITDVDLSVATNRIAIEEESKTVKRLAAKCREAKGECEQIVRDLDHNRLFAPPM